MSSMPIARYCGYFLRMSTKILTNILRQSHFSDLGLPPRPGSQDNFLRLLWSTLPLVRPDPIELEVFKHLFHSIAEEMGAALRRTAFSPNIKERRDYSCALFDAAAQTLAMGDHMPVHLGSMPMSVRAAIAELTLAPGDIAMLNDPFRGGTHLPDITVVAPVFIAPARSEATAPARSEATAARAKSLATTTRLDRIPPTQPRHPAAPSFFVAARAHHADVGGTYAGSMGPCREIYQEGFRIPPVKIVRGGHLDRDLLALLLNNVRTPQEREGDLRAQLAACHTGITRLQQLCRRYGFPRVQRAGHALLDYSEQMMRAFLATIPPGTYAAEDFLDDDGVRDAPVRIAVRITFPRKSSNAPPIVFVPLITFVVSVVTQWILLLLMSAVLAGTGFNVASLWTHFFLGHMWLMLLYHFLTVHALWYAPIFGYLLLVSAWSRRGAFLWATMPPTVIVILEKIAFNTHYFSDFLAYRFHAGPEGGMSPNMLFMAPMSNLTPLQFLWSTGLWDGLALTAIFLAGAVLLRRYRGVTTS